MWQVKLLTCHGPWSTYIKTTLFFFRVFNFPTPILHPSTTRKKKKKKKEKKKGDIEVHPTVEWRVKCVAGNRKLVSSQTNISQIVPELKWQMIIIFMPLIFISMPLIFMFNTLTCPSSIFKSPNSVSATSSNHKKYLHEGFLLLKKKKVISQNFDQKKKELDLIYIHLSCTLNNRHQRMVYLHSSQIWRCTLQSYTCIHTWDHHSCYGTLFQCLKRSYFSWLHTFVVSVTLDSFANKLNLISTSSHHCHNLLLKFKSRILQ